MTHLKVFSATWCGPCKAMKPTIEELVRRGLTVVEVDIDADKAIAAIHQVKGIPTFKLYKDDQLLKSHTGSMTLGQLELFTTT